MFKKRLTSSWRMFSLRIYRVNRNIELFSCSYFAMKGLPEKMCNTLISRYTAIRKSLAIKRLL